MSILDPSDVLKTLTDTGNQLKSGLWKSDDTAFLQARAKDMVGLAAKAAREQDPGRKAAYLAAARDTVTSVRLLAMIRLETAEQAALAAAGNFFTTTVTSALKKLLPSLGGL